MKYYALSFLFPLICQFGTSSSFANPPTNPTSSFKTANLFQQNKQLLFVENKGQLKDENHKAITNVKYYSHTGSVHVYCKAGIISFIFIKIDNGANNCTSEASGTFVETQNIASLRSRHQLHHPSKISTSRMDLVLIGSNPNAKITASDQQAYYENYYTTGDADKGIINVNAYKTIIYKNIYSNIDMILNPALGGMEYSFIVHPGGRVRDIKLCWNGTSNLENLISGGIRYQNVLGSIEESTPKSFVDGQEVKSSFIKKKNNCEFKVENYNNNKDLLIDPTLNWATYYGGANDEHSCGISMDASENKYITGYTFSNSGVATTGAYQTSFAGAGTGAFSGDAFLAKFGSSGNLLWATYFGGSEGDEGYGVSTDNLGNLYISGETISTNGIATSSAYQTSYGGGGTDAFLAKFSSSGSLSWATYYGGDGEDYGDCVCTDFSGNVYIAGTSASSNGIATSGAYHTSGGGTNFDAFLAKFSSSGSLILGTYYGGNGPDFAKGISADALGNVCIMGYTNSNSDIASSGAYQTSFGGGNYDVFLAKFSILGSLSWATYYGGSEDDYGYGLSNDGSGNIYLTGTTPSSSGIATSGAYQTSMAGVEDAFLAKFSSSGSLVWATYFGGSGDDYGYGLCTDLSGNIYMTGSTPSSSGIATSGAYQTSMAGGTDAFIAKFNSSGSPIWATYYGGSAVDYGNGVSADTLGNVYIVGDTKSIESMATSGMYQTSLAGGYDVFLAKFGAPKSGISQDTNSDLYSLFIYPNPFIDKTTIKFDLPTASNVKISIVDMMGNIVYCWTDKTFGQGKNDIEINANEADLSPGTYFVNIMINDQFINQKIIEIR